MNPATLQIYTLSVLGLLVFALFYRKVRATAAFFLAAFLLVLGGALEPGTFLQGFVNPSIVTIFLLIFITAGIKDNYNLIGVLDRIFGRTANPRKFQFGMMVGSSLLSSVINNTPIVAMMIPYVHNWARKHGVAPSKLLIPLSYSTILGGMITLIGTSTNLVLNGLLTSNGEEGFAFHHFFFLGLIVTVLGWIYFSTIGYKLLPEHRDLMDELMDHKREYVLETRVALGAGIAGKTVKQAGLRKLDGVYLIEIFREKELISPVSPREVLRENDLLYFAGDTHRILDLVRSDNGLELANTREFNLEGELELIETVVPANSNLAGKKVKETDFRERFDAAIIAVHRDGQKLGGKIGSVELKYGDMLLLSTGDRFRRRAQRNKDLYVVSEFERLRNKPGSTKRRVYGLFFILLIGAMITGWLSLLSGLMIMLFGLLGLGMLGKEEIKKQFNLDLFIILGSALALGKALINTGAAAEISESILQPLAGHSPLALMGGLFLLTLVLTSFVTNVAAVSVVFPVAYAALSQAGVEDPMPYYLTIAFAASCAFLTPVSYQTNLMVYGPGNYRFRDFLKVGFPLTILYALICTAYLTSTYNLLKW